MNSYLVLLVAVLFIGLSGRVLYISETFGKNFRLIAVSEFAILLFGATVYLFTKSSLGRKRLSRKEWLHYLPGLVYSVFVILYFMMPSDEVIVARIRSGQLYRVVNVLVGIGLLVNTAYWGASISRYFRFRNELNNELSFTVRTQFFLNFLMAVGLCLLVWTLIYGMSLFHIDSIEREARQIIWLSLAMIILFITYYGMVSPELFRIAPVPGDMKYRQSKLSSSDLDALKLQLEQMMEVRKPYRNAKLMKAELAVMLGISNPELARLLNERIGMNFFDFVNYYRIKEFIALAKTERAKELTFFGLAQEAGFNSKTTFNKAFKSLMGTSPSAYLGKRT